ncbi:retrovirus-related pol polyprotein from transposon TNT 1-94 [Tanacetum coccineum]
MSFIPFEKQTDDPQKETAKIIEATKCITALPRKEYDKNFHVPITAKEIWKTFATSTHQGNSQVKDNKIDLLVQQYKQFVISEDESINSAFAKFNTIITSLKALDEGYSSKKLRYGKFLGSTSKESKSMEYLRVERLDIISLDNPSDEVCSTPVVKDEEYAISRIVKTPKDKNQRAFVGGSWSDSGEEDDEKVKDETCLVAHASSEVCSESSYFSDENSSIDDIALDNEYDNAFLNGFINEEVYVAQPPGFIDFEKPDHVYKLKKALYGLKQAPKAWYDRLKAFLIKHEYKMGMVDNTLFTKKKSSNLIIVQIYVDDIIFGSTCQDMCDEFAKIMHDEFEMSMMGELNFFLGLQIKQMEDGIFFNQSKYIKEMLKKFGLEDSKPMKTPMSSDTKLTKDEECESVDSTKYRGMIGSLLYLTASRPDIMFSVCLCARFQEAPKTSHLEAVKRIFRYIKGTTHLGLWYPKGTDIETVVYADSDHAGDYVDRKSTSGICTFVGCCLTSWFSKKQTALAISTTEAKYVSAGKACQQALWMKQALIDYDVRLDDVPIMCDNKGAIDLSKNPVQHSRTKHIEIRHHFLRDNVQKGHISIKKVPSVDNIADILTKPLKRESFNYLRLGLGMMEHIP